MLSPPPLTPLTSDQRLIYPYFRMPEIGLKRWLDHAGSHFCRTMLVIRLLCSGLCPRKPLCVFLGQSYKDMHACYFGQSVFLLGFGLSVACTSHSVSPPLRRNADGVEVEELPVETWTLQQSLEVQLQCQSGYGTRFSSDNAIWKISSGQKSSFISRPHVQTYDSQ